MSLDILRYFLATKIYQRQILARQCKMLSHPGGISQSSDGISRERHKNVNPKVGSTGIESATIKPLVFGFNLSYIIIPVGVTLI
ncbi:hypothetical protein BI334_23860 [Moorena producens 3L]|nr:hypothetical protein BI334_23860 [Moorena producens 3L]